MGKPGRCHRGHWRPAEDEKLRELLQQYGPQNWEFISEHLEGRSGKSCRLRWYNQLDPNINKKPFTEEEERRLLADHRIYGNKWASIARRFNGRTDNAVKNHYHVIMARRKRERLLSSSSLDSSSFSQSTDTTASLTTFDVFRGGRKDDLDGSTSTCSCAHKGLHGVPGRHPFRFLKKMGCEKEEQGDGSSLGPKPVPFIDFLGVGSS